MSRGAVCNDAFLVCHEIYGAARELVNSRVPTTQLQSPSKFLWRPDLRPRLVEYVADFARCGERALGETSSSRKNAVMPTAFFGSTTPDLRGKADTDYRTPKARGHHAAFGEKRVPRASRLILFRMYYLGGAEYEAARLLLGLSERTWSDWAGEIRQRVGAELIHARMYPPARYFREAWAVASPNNQASLDGNAPAPDAASTNGAPEAKIESVLREPDFA
jgi:hypothetical protein